MSCSAVSVPQSEFISDPNRCWFHEPRFVVVGFFVFRWLSEVCLANINEKLTEILKPSVEGMGFELWGIEFRHQGRHSTLVVYIDKEDGITIDDCSDVSRQVSAVLDVEDVITYAYDLEISSPGMDRLLFTFDQMKQYIGSDMNVELNMPVDNCRKFKGCLESVADTVLTFRLKGETSLEVLYSNVKKARLVPVF